MSILAENYEAKHYPTESPDPLEAIKIRMEEQGLKRKDMIDYFGSASRGVGNIEPKAAANLRNDPQNPQGIRYFGGDSTCTISFKLLLFSALIYREKYIL